LAFPIILSPTGAQSPVLLHARPWSAVRAPPRRRLSDNIGRRGPYVALSGLDSAWSLFIKINQGKVRRMLVIAASARTGRDLSGASVKARPAFQEAVQAIAPGRQPPTFRSIPRFLWRRARSG